MAVLEDKVRAARAEQELRAQEVQDMMRRYKEADANRFVLLNEIRRAQSQRRMNDMARRRRSTTSAARRRRWRAEIAYGDALDELNGLGPDPAAPPPSQGSIHDDVEARLQEMKRRMGKA